MFPLPAAPAGSEIAVWKRFFQDCKSAYRQHLKPHFAVQHWIRHWTRQVDVFLRRWAQTLPAEVSLYAIGGYGRGELYPASDLDLLFICPQPEALQTAISGLWQLGFQLSPRVLRAEEIRDFARQDYDFLTSMLEARHLAGAKHDFQWREQPLISVHDYLNYKIQEQKQREQHAFGRLEPDVKNDAGGLRDVHMMTWLQHYSGIAPDFNRSELRRLHLGRNALARLRFALHLLEPRGKDVLRFAQQKQLAQILTPHTNPVTAVETLMRDYYRHQRRLRQLNAQYLTLLRQKLQPDSRQRWLDEDFYIAQNLLHFQGQSLNPEQLWRIFLHWQREEVLLDLAPALSRLLAQERSRLFSRKKALIQQHFTHFRQFLAQKPLFRSVQRLHRYGLLHRVIPDFWHIVGRMQFDLFHQYTVDQHSLRLLHYFDRFAAQEEALYPQAHAIMQRIAQPDILALAALLHDMGKGRNGDHSEIGAQLAQRYARFGGLNEEESALLVFLVRHHLTFSLTAQKQDIYNPQVLAQLRHLMPKPEYLDYWYLLTLADISATQEQLWNSWRAQLLWTLYQQLRQQESASPLEAPTAALQHFWGEMPRDFFLGKDKALLLRQTQVLMQEALPIVDVQEQRILLMSAAPSPILFLQLTHFVERHHGTIVEARLYRTQRGLNVQEYRLQEALPYANWEDLRRNLTEPNWPPPLKKRFPRAGLKHFPLPIQIELKAEATQLQLLLSCQDAHGLLSCLSRVFIAENALLQHAKIHTFGERAEDSFIFAPLDKEALTRFEQHLRRALQDFYASAM